MFTIIQGEPDRIGLKVEDDEGKTITINIPIFKKFTILLRAF